MSQSSDIILFETDDKSISLPVALTIMIAESRPPVNSESEACKSKNVHLNHIPVSYVGIS